MSSDVRAVPSGPSVEAWAGRLTDHLGAERLGLSREPFQVSRTRPRDAAVRRPVPEVDRPGSYPRASIPQVCHGRHELEEQLAGEEDEDEPAPGPTKGIRVERDDRHR